MHRKISKSSRALLALATLLLAASSLAAHDLFLKLNSYFLLPDTAAQQMVDLPHRRDSPPPAPRWVYVIGILIVVLVVLVVILHLTGRGLGGHLHR